MTEERAFTHRKDPAVPRFDDSGWRVVMDAQCGLCARGARGARWIALKDRQAAFKIIPLQSALGQALMRHYALDPKDPTSWLLLEDGRAFTEMDAVLRVGKRLGGLGKVAQILRVLPRPWRNSLYRLVARHRYRLFGKGDLCGLPDQAVQDRLLQ